VTAARELFASRGITGATVAAIAAQAGVAEPTVYATFGSKREIMAALLVRTEGTAQAPAWAEQIADEDDPARKLDLFAGWSRALFTSSHDLVAAVHRSPAVIELMDEGNRRRREALESLIGTLKVAGALRTDITVEEAVDRAWILTAPELYLLATVSCSWSPEAYQDWLSALLRDQILLSSPPVR
jgi:AcrR family transcriptional regulator